MYTLLADLFPRQRPLFLKELSIPAAARITVLAPHPDDFDVAGVTLRFFQDQGNRIDLAVLTSGASGVEDDFSASPDTAVKAALREAEQRASCRFFGLPESRLVFLRL